MRELMPAHKDMCKRQRRIDTTAPNENVFLLIIS